jgi:hypothetical protein
MRLCINGFSLIALLGYSIRPQITDLKKLQRGLRLSARAS